VYSRKQYFSKTVILERRLHPQPPEGALYSLFRSQFSSGAQQ